MARIRTVKPEFFTSPDTARVSHAARLLFVAMWCWADDHGRGELNLLQLRAFAFPEDDPWLDWALENPTAESVGNSDGDRRKFLRLLSEVVEGFGITVYEHRGRKFYEIPSWGNHQRTERSAKERYPRSDDPGSILDVQFSERNGTPEESVGNSDGDRRKLSEAPKSSGPGTGNREHRNREQEGGGEVVGQLTTARADATDPLPSSISLHEPWVDSPRSARCSTHRDTPDPPPCRGCQAVREAHQTERDRREAERRERAEAKATAIRDCPMCDRVGYLLPNIKPAWCDQAVPCTHDETEMGQVIDEMNTQGPPEPEHREPTRGSFEVFEALAAIKQGGKSA